MADASTSRVSRWTRACPCSRVRTRVRDAAVAHSTAERIAEVATVLVDATFRCGVAEIRVVVPGDHRPSLQAWVSLHPAGPMEWLDLRGKRFFELRYAGAS